MENEYICPISFINEKQKQSDQLNELFVAGFRDKVCIDYTHSIIIDSIKNTFDFENLNPNQNAWLGEINTYEYNAFLDAVISYMICNITDLTANTLILVLQDLYMPNDVIGAIISKAMEEMKIRSLVEQMVASEFNNLIRDDSIEQIYITINTKMNTIYSIMIAKVFDAFVDFVVYGFAGTGSIMTLFENLFHIIYGKDKDVPETIDSYSNIHVFCTSVIREAIDKHTLNFREGLMAIAKNAALMCTGNPKYGMNTFNPNYKTSIEEYHNTGLFGDDIQNLYLLTGETPNNENQE